MGRFGAPGRAAPGSFKAHGLVRLRAWAPEWNSTNRTGQRTRPRCYFQRSTPGCRPSSALTAVTIFGMDCIAPDRPRFAICTKQTLTLALTLSSLQSRASRHLHDHLKFDNSSPQSNHPPRAQGYEEIANSSPHILLLAASYLSCRSALESTGFPFGRSCREGQFERRERSAHAKRRQVQRTSFCSKPPRIFPSQINTQPGGIDHRDGSPIVSTVPEAGRDCVEKQTPPARALSFDLSFMTETQRKHLPFFRPASRTFTV